MSGTASTGDRIFAVVGGICAIVATLIFLWIGKGIARMGHSASHESPAAEAGEAH